MKELVFVATELRTRCELLEILLSSGFTLHDDVVSLDRNDDPQIWQASAMADVLVTWKGTEVYGFSGGYWDSIVVRYLFAWLPFELADAFVQAVEVLITALDLVPTLDGQGVRGVALRQLLDLARHDVLAHTGFEVGSEELAILIQSTYPREPGS